MRNAKGFTILELVIVMVIIGLLLAVAIPSFFELRKEARIAKLNAFVGAVNSMQHEIRAKVLLEGQPLDSTPGEVIMVGADGVAEITVPTLYGWGNLTTIDARDFVVAQSNNNAPVNYLIDSSGTYEYTEDGSSAVSDCSVQLLSPAAADELPVAQYTTAGC